MENLVNLNHRATMTVKREKVAKNNRTTYKLCLYGVSLRSIIDLLEVHPNDNIEYISTPTGDVVFLPVLLGGNSITYHMNEDEISHFMQTCFPDYQSRINKTDLKGGKNV